VFGGLVWIHLGGRHALFRATSGVFAPSFQFAFLLA